MRVHSHLNNVFDQYNVEENRVTNAFLQTLSKNKNLLRNFLKNYFNITLSKSSKVIISCQKKPFSVGDIEEKREELQSVPDGWIIIDENTAIVFEIKIHSNSVERKQLKSHVRWINNFDKKYLCVITPDERSPISEEKINSAYATWISWKNIYRLVNKCKDNRSQVSCFLTSQLKEFLTMKENLVGFQGINYSDDTYNAREAKIILKNLIQEIREDVVRDYPLLTSERKVILETTHPYTVHHRSIWSCIGSEGKFTDDTHVTLWLHETHLGIGITVPHNAKERWKRLIKIFKDDKLFSDFLAMLHELRLRVPHLYLEFVHRHYLWQKYGIVDGIVEVDMDTIREKKGSHVKANSLWLDVIRELAKNKKGYNGQFMVRTRYFYKDHPKMGNTNFKKTILGTISDFKDIYDFLSVSV